MPEVKTFATCICGERTSIPPVEVWKQERKELCDDEDCEPLDKCRNCQWKRFLTRYCSCDCDNCSMTQFYEVEIEEGDGADFGLTGVSRIPKEERWNPALGEYCRTTGEVEKHRKKQGKVYVKDDDPPKPYQPSSDQEAKEKRREFAENAVSVEIEEDA